MAWVSCRVRWRRLPDRRGRLVRHAGALLLKLKLQDSPDKALYSATGGQPYTSEMAVEVLGRGRDETPAKGKDRPLPAASITPEEPPSSALLAGVGGGLAIAGFAAGALALWRRRT